MTGRQFAAEHGDPADWTPAEVETWELLAEADRADTATAAARETNAFLDTVRAFGVSSPATAKQIARTHAALDEADATGTPSAEIRAARRRG